MKELTFEMFLQIIKSKSTYKVIRKGISSKVEELLWLYPDHVDFHESDKSFTINIENAGKQTIESIEVILQEQDHAVAIIKISGIACLQQDIFHFNQVKEYYRSLFLNRNEMRGNQVLRDLEGRQHTN